MNDFERDHLYPFYVMIRTDGRYNVHHLIKGLCWGPYDSWDEANDEATKLKGQEYRNNLWPYSDEKSLVGFFGTGQVDEVSVGGNKRKKRYKKELTRLFCKSYALPSDGMEGIDRAFIKKAAKMMLKAYKDGRNW